MAESSNPTHVPLPPKLIPKEEPDTQPLNRPDCPNPFLHTLQVEFNFDEITFNTNNEVALLYPSHSNSEYFKAVWDFISKCCLKEAFTRAPNQYKEYLFEFWYTAKTLEENKIWVTTPTRAIRGKVSVATFSSALRANYLSHSNQEAQSSLIVDANPNQLLVSTPMDADLHKEDQQAVGGPTYLEATVKKEPTLSSIVDVMLQQIPQLKLILEYLLLIIPYLNNKNKKLKQQKNKAKAEVALLTAQPSPNVD
nr:hypothetical protein [Tanacetum cinerariifolium]GEV35277.1 hypothetical protein [Tanacetum cinerariifolium]